MGLYLHNTYIKTSIKKKRGEVGHKEYEAVHVDQGEEDVEQIIGQDKLAYGCELHY